MACALKTPVHISDIPSLHKVDGLYPMDMVVGLRRHWRWLCPWSTPLATSCGEVFQPYPCGEKKQIHLVVQAYHGGWPVWFCLQTASCAVPRS